MNRREFRSARHNGSGKRSANKPSDPKKVRNDVKQKDISNLAIKPVFALADTAVGGLHKEAELEMKYITESILRGKLDCARQTNGRYQDGKTALTATQRVLENAFADALAFAQVLRGVLIPKFGSQYSLIWNAVGFFNHTLRMPRTVPDAIGLVGAMELFLKAHPECATAGLLTPEIAASKWRALLAARTASNSAKTALRQSKAARDEALEELRDALKQLRRELSMILEDNDPRWLSFGFNVPADIAVPQAPEGLMVEPGLPGEAMLSWQTPVNVDRFHVWQQTMGVDAEPMRVMTTSETSKTVRKLVPGAQVRFHITALNAAGESLPSQSVEFVVPVAEDDHA